MIQYFVGAEPSKNVLQLLRLPQEVDRNLNLIDESTESMETVVTGLATPNVEFKQYQSDETSQIIWQPDSSTDNLADATHNPDSPTPLDPGGVMPPPNSAKILSSFYGYRKISQISDINPEYLSQGLGQSANTAGANIGCGWVEKHLFEDQTDCDLYGEGFFGKTCSYAIPAECPKRKFTYLHGVLFAEVTDKVSSDGSIKVLIYPGHIITSSFRVFAKSTLGGGGEIVDSGYQVMRMRYPTDTLFIEGSIFPGANNTPALSTTVNLYMDAPYLVTDLVERKRWMSEMNHNLYSYPVQMRLSGGIQFLSDGRMVVEQYNENALEIHQRANQPITKIDFLVPERGSFLRYVSEPIK